MKSLLIFLLISFTLFMLSSCKKSNNPVGPSETQQQIWPLKIGNTWGYHVVIFDSTGKISNYGNTSISISTDTAASNETWYKIYNSSTGVYYTDRSDGLWMMSNGLQTILYKYPCNVGDVWHFFADSVIVASKDTIVNTSLNKYTCYLYRIFYNGKPVVDDYLSPGVGLVAEDYYSSMNSGKVYIKNSLSLISITLK
ncbi:MAG: hypothetical protein WBV81_06845 [Ignavibacteriaceae bacterium]